MNRIAELRSGAASPISQSALALALGWSQGRLSNYEAGRRIPTLKDSRAITVALNRLGVDCQLDDVFPPEQEVAA